MGYEYKPGELVEGSTKGKARVAPKNYKGDSLIQVWLDSRKIAMLSVWLDSNGVMTRFMSDVIREALDQLCEALVNNKQAIELETTAARDILNSKYRTNLNPSGRGKRNLINNLVLDDRNPVDITSTSCERIPGYSISEANKKLDEFGDEGPPIDHPLRRVWLKRLLDANHESKGQQYDLAKNIEEAKKKQEETNKRLAEKYAHLMKPSVEIPIMIQAPSTDIPDEAARTSKGASKPKRENNAPRPKTDEEIQADIDRIANKDKELMAALDKIGQPVD